MDAGNGSSSDNNILCETWTARLLSFSHWMKEKFWELDNIPDVFHLNVSAFCLFLETINKSISLLVERYRERQLTEIFLSCVKLVSQSLAPSRGVSKRCPWGRGDSQLGERGQAWELNAATQQFESTYKGLHEFKLKWIILAMWPSSVNPTVCVK